MASFVALLKKSRRLLPLTFRIAAPRATVDLGALADWPAGYFPTNPSIVRVQDGFLASVRGVNYQLHGSSGIKARFTVGDRFTTVNRFLHLSPAMTVTRRLRQIEAAFDGVEDIKLFAVGERIFGTGSRASSANERSCRIVLGEIAADLSGASLRDIASPFGLRQEKNWAPFAHNGDIHFLYSYHPLIVLRFNEATGTVAFTDDRCKAYSPRALPFLVSGSSPGIEIPGGYLFVAHRRSVRLPTLRRTYLSRLYHLARDLRTVTGGPYFVINMPSVQFVSGLMVDDRSAYVAYGQNDCSARLADFDPAVFWRLWSERQGRSARLSLGYTPG